MSSHSESRYFRQGRRRQTVLGSLATTCFTIVTLLTEVSEIDPFTSLVCVQASDIGHKIRQTGVAETNCLTYENATFDLSCNFDWNKNYTTDDYILLKAGERFSGNDYEIDLSELSDPWKGLFKIESTVDWDYAPIIEHLHMIGGQTSANGGFIIYAKQNNFIVESCSSTGAIHGKCSSEDCQGGGGICGHQCSGTILLTHCWSIGTIGGGSTNVEAGGIAGSRLAFQGGSANITQCFSEGGISGMDTGGICGARTAMDGGSVTITKSFTKGIIQGKGSGGICGAVAAEHGGDIKLFQCYTLGDIIGEDSGGISG